MILLLIVKPMQINILVIDDHQPFTDIFFSVLQSSNTKYVVKECNSLQCGFEKLFDANHTTIYNAVVMDYNIPPYLSHDIKNGADLAKMVRAKFPNTKVIMMSDKWEPIALRRVLKQINPEGILHKCDITRNCIPTIFEKVFSGETFYSERVLENMKTMHHNDENFDDCDRLILLYLSEGYQTNDLESMVYLSVSAIKKRKHKMKEFFDIEGCSDIVLIQMAKEKQII